MDINDILKEMSGLERLIYTLRALYGKNGYRQYQMSKFEEYDLYARNRDFLPSRELISFTNTDGKLMALKPDVTLSIIKNMQDRPDDLQKLYYDERVYRVSDGSGSFQELRQLGLECMGKVSDDSLGEILRLACDTLKYSAEAGGAGPGGGSAVLELSQIDVLRGIFDAMELSYEQWDSLLPVIQSKNLHELKTLLAAICWPEGTDISSDVSIRKMNAAAKKKSRAAAFLLKLVEAPGDAEQMIKMLKGAPKGLVRPEAVSQLEDLINGLPEELRGMIRIDFSLTGNSRYYNGIVFQGYIRGIPSRVLAGGQYDRMMQRMGRKSGACGFALYLNLLERMGDGAQESADRAEAEEA